MDSAVRDVEKLVFRTLLGSRVPVAIFSWRNEEGWPVDFVSPNVEHVLGYTADDFVSGRVVYANIIHPDDLARVVDEVLTNSASGAAAFEHEDYRVIDRSGRPRWVRDHTAIVRDADGRITHYLGYILDSTARHDAKLALEQARREAEAAMQAKSEFLANVSHELRTPLTLILGPVDALLSGEAGPLSEEATRSLERVHRNAERLFGLVSDLLDFSKLEANKERVGWTAVDLVALVRSLVDDAREAASAAGIDLELQVAGDAGVVAADRQKVERIVLNLLGNALKFTPSGGRVEVRLRFSADDVELVVADTGPGIAPEDLERIFLRFEQGDASITRRHEGTGIGLALVKAFTELMGGTVNVESELGKGSRFIVRLSRHADLLTPLVAADWREQAMARERRHHRQSRAEPRTRATAGERGGRPRVIVADDNADMRGFMAEVLEDRFDVETVTNGAEALAAARRRRPSVVVCDWMMPEVDGLEVVRQLKADEASRDIPVILVTARAGRRELVGALESGADDFLTKPFDASELRARVHAAERLHRAYLELALKHEELAVAHRRLQTTQDQLVQAGKLAAVGALTAGISHELNNPMATIVLNTERLLRNSPPSSPLHARLEIVERQALRCRELVRALHSLARDKPTETERVTVETLLESVEPLARSQARGRDVIVDAPGVEGGLPEVEVSVQEMETVLVNLVSNALEATSPGGRVSLRARARARDGRAGVEIEVTDTGSGIPADVLPRIFDPFFSTKDRGERAGLGLALVQRIVRSAGGQVDVASEVGRGTTVRVWLAGVSAPQEQPSSPRGAPS